MKKTYKQQLIDKITKKILYYDRILSVYQLKNAEISLMIKTNSEKLRTIRKRIQSLHGKHFIPNRFKSSEFISIKLSLESLSIYI